MTTDGDVDDEFSAGSDSALLQPGDFVYLDVSWTDPLKQEIPLSDSLGVLLGSERYQTLERTLIGSPLDTEEEFLIRTVDGISEFTTAPALETVFDTQTAQLLDQLGYSTIGTFLNADLSSISLLPIDSNRLQEMRDEVADSIGDSNIVSISVEEIYRWSKQGDLSGTGTGTEDAAISMDDVETSALEDKSKSDRNPINTGGWNHQWPTSGGNFRRSGSRDPIGVTMMTGTACWTNNNRVVQVADAAPAVVDGQAFVWTDRGMAALDALSGDVVWHKKYPALTEGHEGWPFDLQSPIVADETVYFAPQLTAFDSTTGDRQRKITPMSANARVSIADERLLITGADSLLRSEELSIGETRIEIEGIDGAEAQHVPAYSADHGTALVTNNTGTLCSVDLRSGSIDWRVGHRGSFRTPAVGTHAYAVTSDQQLVAVDMDSGKDVWQSNVSPLAISDPAVTDERVYVTAPEGLYGLDSHTGETVFEYSFAGKDIDFEPDPDTVPPRPTVVQDYSTQIVFAAVGPTLHAINPLTKEQEWYPFNDTATTQPVYANGRVYVRTADGVLHAIE